MAAGAILMAAIAAALCMQCTYAVQLDVGDRAGWDPSADLKTWASTKHFSTGDSLVFKYAQIHSLVEVNKAGYDSCSPAAPIKSYTDGNTAILLSSEGKRYFICGTPGHCNAGMKLEVDTQLARATVPSLAPAQVPVSNPVASRRHHSHAHSPTAKIHASPSFFDGPAPVPSSGSRVPRASAAPDAASPKAQSGATSSHNYDNVVNNFMAVVAAMVTLVVL